MPPTKAAPPSDLDISVIHTSISPISVAPTVVVTALVAPTCPRLLGCVWVVVLSEDKNNMALVTRTSMVPR